MASEVLTERFESPPGGHPILFKDYPRSNDKPTTLYLSKEVTGCASGVMKVVDMQGNSAYTIQCTGIFSMKRVLYDAKGDVLAVMSKNPFFLGKWAISTPDGRILMQTRCTSGMVKFGLVGCAPNRDYPQSLTMFPCYELNKIEFSKLLTPGNDISVDNRCPFAIAQYGPNVASAFQAFTNDFTFILCIAPGADIALALCCLATYDDLAEWNATAGFAGMVG